MISAVPTLLDRIVAHKRSELASFRHSLADLERLATVKLETRRDFASALRRPRPSIIAELKKASPSKGLIAAEYAPSTIAIAYQQGGAAALSVLTDREFFQGTLEDLQTARAASSLPVLRKDFTIDARQILEAAAHGADAILLIAAILSDAELRNFEERTQDLGLAALVEVHDETELKRAIDAGALLIGVNNRDLHTFEVRLETSLRLAELMPPGVTRVAESGIQSADDVRRLWDAGYNAFLVGEHLMTSPDPAAAVRNLTKW